jgi:hypothetical protein
MTNNNDTDLPDERQLQDEAAEAADSATESLQRLCEEGIPQRAERLREEMFEMVEAVWLIANVLRMNITRYCEPEITTRLLALKYANACETSLFHAMRGLEPLARNDAGVTLDSALDGAFRETDDNWKK